MDFEYNLKMTNKNRNQEDQIDMDTVILPSGTLSNELIETPVRKRPGKHPEKFPGVFPMYAFKLTKNGEIVNRDWFV